MNENKNNSISMTVQTLQRLPLYLQHLKNLRQEGVAVVSATEAADSLKLNEVLVRKDFGLVSTNRGKPKVGFRVSELIYDIETKLGYHDNTDVALVGVGSLGKALFAYEGFETCGLRIAVGFDKDEKLAGKTVNGKKILPTDQISDVCRRMRIQIGVIAVPSGEAQAVCDQLVAGGVLAIWNFTSVHLSVPDHILIKNENLVTSLTVLAKQLEEKELADK